MFGHFCDLEKVHVLSVFRHNYAVVLILSGSISDRMTLSDISVVGNGFCSTGEHQSLAVSMRAAPRNTKSQMKIPGQPLDGRD